MIDFWVVDGDKVFVKDKKSYFLAFSKKRQEDSLSVLKIKESRPFYICEKENKDFSDDVNWVDPLKIFKAIFTSDFPKDYYLDEPFYDNLKKGIVANHPTGLKITDRIYIPLLIEDIELEDLEKFDFSYRYNFKEKLAVILFDGFELELMLPIINEFKKKITSKGAHYKAPTHHKYLATLLQFYLIGGTNVL